MSEGLSSHDPVVALAARGDGLTRSGRHVVGAVPGDVLASDGTVVPGPHRAIPPCRHFDNCGACQLQHVDEEALAQFVGDRITGAARGQDLDLPPLRTTHLSPPRSRRRATLHAFRVGGRTVIGFRMERSHRVVDMRECHVLHPELFALVSPLRTLLDAQTDRFAADIALTKCDTGVDVNIAGVPFDGFEQAEALQAFARDNRLARLTIDSGFGPETVWEPEPVTITVSGIAVPYPPGAFLQATADGETALVEAVAQWLVSPDVSAKRGGAPIADLFAGLGTFAFACVSRDAGAKVLAVEAARDAHLACRTAARQAGLSVHALHRDLFRNPLRAEELDRFGAVILDPPRAGARDQVTQIADSAVKRVAYVSCNPSSWARDAATLVGAGFRIAEVRPVGQFRWSTHVELASLFVR